MTKRLATQLAQVDLAIDAAGPFERKVDAADSRMELREVLLAQQDPQLSRRTAGLEALADAPLRSRAEWESDCAAGRVLLDGRYATLDRNPTEGQLLKYNGSSNGSIIDAITQQLSPELQADFEGQAAAWLESRELYLFNGRPLREFALTVCSWDDLFERIRKRETRADCSADWLLIVAAVHLSGHPGLVSSSTYGIALHFVPPEFTMIDELHSSAPGFAAAAHLCPGRHWIMLGLLDEMHFVSIRPGDNCQPVDVRWRRVSSRFCMVVDSLWLVPQALLS